MEQRSNQSRTGPLAWSAGLLGATVSFLLALCGCGSKQPAACPVCGGPLVKIGTVTDDTNALSKNISVWNRSICANLLYGDDSVICTRCWHAHSEFTGTWQRAS